MKCSRSALWLLFLALLPLVLAASCRKDQPKPPNTTESPTQQPDPNNPNPNLPNACSKPAAPVIVGEMHYHVGDTLLLSIQSPDTGLTYGWATPDGFGAGTTMVVEGVQLFHAGTYSATAERDTCLGEPGSVQVVVEE